MKNAFRVPSRRPTKQGSTGYDNARDNIDPHVKTQAISTKEIIGKTGVFSISVTAPNLNIADWDTAYSWGDHAGLYVPYTGANANVNIGSHEFQAEKIGINLLSGNTPNKELDIQGDINIQTVTSPSVAAMAFTLGGPGNVNSGTHRYAVCFYTSKGTTYMSADYVDVVITDNTANGQVLFTGIPISTDPLVIGRKLFRSKGGGSTTTKNFVVTIADNTTTTYTDNIADASLPAGDYRSIDNFTGGGIFKDNLRYGFLGKYNSGIGYLSLNAYNPPTGYYNFGLGNYALKELTTGVGNTAVGTYSSQNITSASNNTSVGSYSLLTNSTGYENVAIGASCLRNLSSTRRNVAVGYNSFTSWVGSYGVSIGYYAGTSATAGTGFTNVGYESMRSATWPTAMTVMGYKAGYYPAGVVANACTSSTYCTFIGYQSGLGSPTQRTKSIAIGTRAVVDSDNTCVIGGQGVDAVKTITGDSSATYQTVETNGDTFWTGSGSGIAYGIIAGDDETITCTTQSTYYQVTFDTVGQENMMTGSTANNEIVISKTGAYEIILHVSLHSANAQDFEILLKKNNGATELFHGHMFLTTGVSSKQIGSSVSTLDRLTANDTIEAWVRCTSAGAKDCIFDHVSIVLKQVGG